MLADTTPLLLPSLAAEESKRRAMDARVIALRTALETSKAKVSHGPGDSAARASVLGALGNVEQLVNRLASTLRDQVLGGTMELERWERIAREHATGIEGIAGVAVSWGQAFEQVVVASAADLKAGALAVAGGLSWALAAAAAVVVVIGAVYLAHEAHAA